MTNPIVLLPGLGADSTLFIEQKKHFGDRLITPSWISSNASENLARFSKRFAEHLIKNELSPTKEFFVGGFSFGGMVALEVASTLSSQNLAKIKGVILLSSGRTNQILKRLFKLQAVVGAQLPDLALRWILENQMVKKFTKEESLSSEQEAYLKSMVDHLDLNFFRWSLGACAQWDPQERFLGDGMEFPIFEIQGEDDGIIPSSTEPGVVTLKGAKHLIQYTHAKEVNQWLEQITQVG